MESQWLCQLCRYGFQEKIYGRRCVELVSAYTGVATSSNMFVPSAHSEGESPSQVPGQTCGPCELVR